MIKDLVRGVGIGCILAGGILYFTNTDPDANEANNYKAQLKEVQIELDTVKKELAIAQTLTSPKAEGDGADSSAANIENTKPTSDKVTTSNQITKAILTIEAGSTSASVAKKLERAGIIENAKEFEKYLLDKGLAGRIQIGEHEVDTTMDLDTIASIITNTKNR